MEYILAEIQFDYLEGPDVNELFEITWTDFTSSSSTGTNYARPPAVIPPVPQLANNLLPGTSRQGWLILQVSVNDAAPVMGFGQDLLNRGGGWWALYP